MSDKPVKRLFIGNLSPQLVESSEDLVQRLTKFGEIKSQLETHYNPVRDSSFGYIDIAIDDKGYSKLKGSLHGVNYKGGKLMIDVAKESYKEVWKKHLDDEELEKEKETKLLKQQWEFFKKLQNINKTFVDRQQTIKGRMRKIPRKDIKKMTFRIITNDTVKIIKTHKTKLWGYEKNKKLRDLVFKFQNGVWKDGNEHIVERLSAIDLKQSNLTLRIERDDERNDDVLLKTVIEEDEEEQEQNKNTKVLANILGNFDFDKQLDYKEEVDEFGDSEYEYDGMTNNSDNEDEHDLEKVDLSTIEYVKEGEFNKKATQFFYNEDEEDDFNDDIYDKANMGFAKPQNPSVKETPIEEQIVEEDSMEVDNSDEDTEFIPTFGQTTDSTTSTEHSKVSSLFSGTVSNTETLRGLFNRNDENSFKLIEEDDDDIDQTKQIVQSDIKLPEFKIKPIISKSKNTKALFFPHFDSPFLIAQTQINKLNSNVDFGNWGEEFWDKRSEWTKEMKTRRRDVLRQIRKRNAKNSKIFV